MTITPRFVTAALAVFAALLIACGGIGTRTEPHGTSQAEAGKPAPVPSVATVAIGQTLTMTRNILGTQARVEITVSKLRLNVKSGNQFVTPEKGQYVVVDVLIVCVEGKYDANLYAFKFVSADGSVSDPDLPVVKPALGSAELSAGQRTSGAVTFDVAKGAEKGGRIALKDPLGEADAGYWTTG